MATVGEAAPSFTAKDQDGNDVRLEDFRGEQIVLWFYPKADTPGCSREGCGFRDLHDQFAAKGARILGISFDTPAENKAFHDKYGFPYPLLSDPEGAIARQYGAFSADQPGNAKRNTYVIDAEGKLAQSLEDVNAKTHPRSLLDAL